MVAARKQRGLDVIYFARSCILRQIPAMYVDCRHSPTEIKTQFNDRYISQEIIIGVSIVNPTFNHVVSSLKWGETTHLMTIYSELCFTSGFIFCHVLLPAMKYVNTKWLNVPPYGNRSLIRDNRVLVRNHRVERWTSQALIRLMVLALLTGKCWIYS